MMKYIFAFTLFFLFSPSVFAQWETDGNTCINLDFTRKGGNLKSLNGYEDGAVAAAPVWVDGIGDYKNGEGSLRFSDGGVAGGVTWAGKTHPLPTGNSPRTIAFTFFSTCSLAYDIQRHDHWIFSWGGSSPNFFIIIFENNLIQATDRSRYSNYKYFTAAQQGAVNGKDHWSTPTPGKLMTYVDIYRGEGGNANTAELRIYENGIYSTGTTRVGLTDLATGTGYGRDMGNTTLISGSIGRFMISNRAYTQGEADALAEDTVGLNAYSKKKGTK